MTAVTVHIRDRDVIATRDSHAIVLVRHPAVSEDSVVAAADIEAIGIMSSCEASRAVVWCVSSAVVQNNVLDN